MFIPDPFFPSRIRIFSIVDLGSPSKNLIILAKKKFFSALGNVIRVVHPGSGSYIFTHPDPGSRGQKGTGTWIRIRNTAMLILVLFFSTAGHHGEL
jgi:hypothetical protein